MSFNLSTQTVNVGGRWYALSNMPASTSQEVALFDRLQDLQSQHAMNEMVYGDFSDEPATKSQELQDLEAAAQELQRQWQSIQIGFSPFSEEFCAGKAKNLNYYRLLPGQQDPRSKLLKTYEQLVKNGIYVDPDTFTVYFKRYANNQGAPLRVERYSVKGNDGTWALTYSYVNATDQIWEDLSKENTLSVDHLASGYWMQGYPVETCWCKKQAKNAFRKLVKSLTKA